MSQVIVVGSGKWGQNLVHHFYELGALAGVVEISANLQQDLSRSYPDVKIYSDYTDALETENSAIVIATPAPTHYSLALLALQAGKHVFIEKPMTLKKEEAVELAEYADSTNRILMVGHLLLYQPAIRWLKNHLAGGKARQVWHLSMERLKLGRVRQGENVWWSFAPHDISVMLELLGNPKVKLLKVGGHQMLQSGIEDDVRVYIEFETGQTAHLHCSWYWPYQKRETVVLAERQMLVYDEVDQKITVCDKGVDEQLQNRDEGSYCVDFPDSEPLRIECEHFLDCLIKGSRPHSDAWNGVAVVEILEMAMEALNG